MKEIFIAVQRLALTKQHPAELAQYERSFNPFSDAIGKVLGSICNLKNESSSKLIDHEEISDNNNNYGSSSGGELIDFLNIVPNEIVCQMAQFLDDKSLASILQCSSQVNEIIDDEQFWQVKCEMVCNSKTLSLHRNTIESYKKIYELFIARKPYYHLRDDSKNVFTFLETSDSSIFSLFDFGLVHVDPRECLESNGLISDSLPIEQQRSIDCVSNNFVTMFTMGIRDVSMLLDTSSCAEFDESEYSLKILPIITELGKKVGIRTINLFIVNHKTNKGVNELVSHFEKSYKPPLPSYFQSKPLKAYILDLEKQQKEGNGMNFIAKVAILSGMFTNRMLRIVGDNRDITFESYHTTPLYNDNIILKEPLKIQRVHIKLQGKSWFPIKKDEPLYIIDQNPTRKTKSFTCQLICMGLAMKPDDLLFCVGCSFKMLVRVNKLISLMDKRTGRTMGDNPPNISKGDAAIVEFEIVDGSFCMISPFAECPPCGRFCLFAIPSHINLENYQSEFSIDLKVGCEQLPPLAVAVCKSISSEVPTK